MKLSANEVANLAAKAARGAGAPPAQATAFGQAALTHLAAGRAPDDLSTALRALPSGPILSLPLALDRLLETIEGDRVQGDLPPHQSVDLTLSYAQSLPFAVSVEHRDAALHLTCVITVPNRPDPVHRIDMPDALYEIMQVLAARTLVPESAASRLSGAGAGLTDND